MKRILAIMIVALSTTSFAQQEPVDSVDDMFTAVRALVAADREMFIAQNLRLTTNEQVLFWPLYDEYRIELDEVNDRLADLLIEYADTWEDVPDELALEMIDEYFEIEEDRIDVRKKAVRRFDNILSARKLARFVQLENKYNVLVELEMANAVPLVE